MPVCFSMTRESRAADIVGDASTMIVRPVPVTWSCKTCAIKWTGGNVWCLASVGRQMLTKASPRHGYWLVRCTLGERAVRFRFSTLASFFRFPFCACIVRNFCKLSVRTRREALGAARREQGEGGAGGAGCSSRA